MDGFTKRASTTPVLDASPRATVSRRTALGGLGFAVAFAPWVRIARAAAAALPAIRREAFRVAEKPVRITGKSGTAVLLNGQLPGPLLRYREGDDLVVDVTNGLAEDTSIHWHGVLVPANMDGVPGISFPGIKPGETFTYRFPLRQSGTYWFHSHSGGQELQGLFAPIIIEPAAGDRHKTERDYVVILSDWSDEAPLAILANLKKDAGYYNYHKRTVLDFFRDLAGAPGSAARSAVIQDRLAWGRMRMDPTDLSDVSGYSFLINGQTSGQNWTGLFSPGERVRLRFINAAGMTIFDVKIPGLPITVVQADGQDVEPVEVDEFRIAPGKTYDVIVSPASGTAYTLFAQSLDRTGYARGTLAERAGMAAPIPSLYPRPLRTMADMTGGMAPMPGMDGASGTQNATSPAHNGDTADASMPGMDMSAMPGMTMPPSAPKESTTAQWKKLRYADLRAVSPNSDVRPPEREIVLRLTGDMERYLWSVNDKKLIEAEPIQLRYGERVRLTYVNETMMEHPMHLHGMFVALKTGADAAAAPRKHTVIVKPGERLSVDFTANERGTWALHCHLLLHMVAGMFVKVIVGDEVVASDRERAG